ncbi:DUF4352 domain-containing protein [Actinomadura graeca]|uniref:DUF4352 domain-containing protein n=1 Tax=Actinomadura graeca TaxID=2750812 RepID=A0ABX8QZJ3_9ACTN|nr:DUF4352 domain-containing protein [Actinomadura graeca]QXJ23614.1 DUF4352 domain-containing protein [Actinomadura graeca]
MRKIAALVATAAGLLLLTACDTGTEPTAVQPAEEAKGAKAAGGKKPKPVPVAIKAKRATFEPGPLNTGGAFTCVKATVTNNTSKNLQINPFFFELTGGDGVKRKADVGEAEGEFDSMMLAPKEKATGLVCAKGRFAPKTITFTRDALGTNYRARVAA